MARKQIDKSWVDAYFDYGVDLDNRRVWLTGEITEDSVKKAIKGLYLMDTISSSPCEMFISSPGGEITETHALYDIIQTLRCDVHTFTFGKCCSAAPLLLAAGTKGHRWVTPHVEFMVHDFSMGVEGKGCDIKSLFDQVDRTNKQWLSLITKHSSMPLSHWRSICSKKTDFYFTADQAIQWGIADQIWDERE